MRVEDLTSDSREKLAKVIEQIESAESERKQTSEHIKSLYSSAEADGFDRRAIRQIIKDRRADTEKTLRLRQTTRVYRKALASIPGQLELSDWARSAEAQDLRMNRPEHFETSHLDSVLSKAKSERPSAPPA